MMDQNANVFSSNWPKDCSAWGMGSPHLKRGRESFTHTEARVTVTPSGFESRGLRCTPSDPLEAAGMCPGGTDLGKPRVLRGGACSGGRSRASGRDAKILEDEAWEYVRPRGVRE